MRLRDRFARVRRAAHVLAAGIWACSCALSQQRSAPTFGTTVVVPGGFVGRVYSISRLSKALPDFDLLYPFATIYTSSLNVPPLNSEERFPGITNRAEWFAIDYTARFWIQEPGAYQFALTSDAGAKLYIDDELVVNND